MLGGLDGVQSASYASVANGYGNTARRSGSSMSNVSRRGPGCRGDEVVHDRVMADPTGRL